MHFQIFVPNKPALQQSLIDAGLSDLAENFDTRESAGPDGERGSVFGWRSPDAPQWGYRPAEQTWIPAVAAGEQPAGRYHVGFWNASPPRPQELARRHQEHGDLLRLGDGQQWLIPVETELPRNIRLNPDGSLRFESNPRYAEYAQAVEKWKGLVGSITGEEQDGNPVSFDELWKFALQALSMNYRITPEVVDHLRLFTTDDVHRPMFAAIGAYRAAAGEQQ